MKTKIADRLYIVLCSPKYTPNVAFTARSMKNMGVSRLRIVSASDINFEEAKLIAVHADDVIDSVQLFDTLDDALADISYAVAFTARERKKGEPAVTLRYCISELAESLNKGNTAFVFGPEDTGLSNENIAICHRNVKIYSSDEFPSLNLSHAVIVALYELVMAYEDMGSKYDYKRITISEENKLQTTIESVLTHLCIERSSGYAGWPQALMSIFKKRDITIPEYNALMGFFNSLKSK